MATSSLSGTGNQPYTQARIDYLASYLQTLLPGMTHDAAVKWIRAEQGVNGNVLGVTYTGSDGKQRLYTYSSQEAGLRAAASLVKGSSNYTGIVGSLASGNTTSQLMAIAASPWNAPSHYNNGKTFGLSSVSNALAGASGTNATLASASAVTISNTPDVVNRYLQARNIDPNTPITQSQFLDYLQWLATQPEGQSGDTKTWLQSGLLDPNSNLFKQYASGWVGEKWSRFASGEGKTLSPQLDPLAGVATSLGTIADQVVKATQFLADTENWKYGGALVLGLPLALLGFYLLAGVPTGGRNA